MARVTLSGRTHYLGPWGTAKAIERYAALIAKWEAGGRQPLVKAQTVVEAQRAREAAAAAERTVAAALADYVAHLEASGRYVKAGKETSHRGNVAKVVAEFGEVAGSKPLRMLDGGDVVAYRRALEGNAKLSRGGINRKLSLLKQALHWLREGKALSREQWADVLEVRSLRRGELPAERDRKVAKRAVTVEEVEQVAAAAGRVVGAMLRLQALTGCRPGEVCGMRHGDIDRNPVVVDGVPCWTWNVAGAKTEHHGHTTRYALGPKAQAILAEFAGVPGAYVFTPRAAVEEQAELRRAARVTPITKQTRDRERRAARRQWAPCYSTNSYTQAVERAIGKTTVQAFTPHQIRHGFVTRAARRFGVLAASTAANHRNVTTTQRYMHAEDLDAYRVVAGLEGGDAPAPAGAPAGAAAERIG